MRAACLFYRCLLERLLKVDLCCYTAGITAYWLHKFGCTSMLREADGAVLSLLVLAEIAIIGENPNTMIPVQAYSSRPLDGSQSIHL